MNLNQQPEQPKPAVDPAVVAAYQRGFDDGNAWYERLQAELEQCRQQLATVIEERDAAVARVITLHSENQQEFIVLLKSEYELFKAQLVTVPGLIRNDVELRAEIKRLNAVIREYATILAISDQQLAAAQKVVAAARGVAEMSCHEGCAHVHAVCDALEATARVLASAPLIPEASEPRTRPGFKPIAAQQEPAPPHKPTDRCVDTCDNPMVCRDLYDAWLAQQETATTPALVAAAAALTRAIGAGAVDGSVGQSPESNDPMTTQPDQQSDVLRINRTIRATVEVVFHEAMLAKDWLNLESDLMDLMNIALDNAVLLLQTKYVAVKMKALHDD